MTGAWHGHGSWAQDALKTPGFGVLTQIDVQTTRLRAALDSLRPIRDSA